MLFSFFGVLGILVGAVALAGERFGRESGVLGVLVFVISVVVRRDVCLLRLTSKVKVRASSKMNVSKKRRTDLWCAKQREACDARQKDIHLSKG